MSALFIDTFLYDFSLKTNRFVQAKLSAVRFILCPLYTMSVLERVHFESTINDNNDDDIYLVVL